MIKECIDNRPLKPSIKLEPLIINKKHKEIKIRQGSFFIGVIGGSVDCIFKKKYIINYYKCS